MVHCQKTPEEPRECVTGISEEVAQQDVAEGLGVLPREGQERLLPGLGTVDASGRKEGRSPSAFLLSPKSGGIKGVDQKPVQGVV